MHVVSSLQTLLFESISAFAPSYRPSPRPKREFCADLRPKESVESSRNDSHENNGCIRQRQALGTNCSSVESVSLRKHSRSLIATAKVPSLSDSSSLIVRGHSFSIPTHRLHIDREVKQYMYPLNLSLSHTPTCV